MPDFVYQLSVLLDPAKNYIFCRLLGDSDSPPLGEDEAACALGEVVGRMAQLRVIE